MERHQVRTVPDVPAAVAADLADAMRDADRRRGRVVLCLAGGSTPVPVYRALARTADLPWARTWVAWGDERMVPPEHEDRNERAARDALLDRVPVPEDQVLTWPWAPDAAPERCADAYEARLRGVLGDPADAPWFDVTLLGLGADAHTAGLFPGSGGATAAGLTAGTRPASQPTARVSLTPRGLSASCRVWFLVAGEGKREALSATLAGTDPEVTPAIAVTAHDDLRVYTDLTL